MVLRSIANVFNNNTRIAKHNSGDGGCGGFASSRRIKQQQKQSLFQQQQQQEGPLVTKSSSILWKRKQTSTTKEEKEEKFRIPSEISITLTSTDCDTCTGSHCSTGTRSRHPSCQLQEEEEYDMVEAYHSSRTTSTTTRTSSWDVGSCHSHSHSNCSNVGSNRYPSQVEFAINDCDSFYDPDENNNDNEDEDYDDDDDDDECSNGQDEGLLLYCCQLNQDSKHTTSNSLGFSSTGPKTKSPKSALVSTSNSCNKKCTKIKKIVSFANSAQVHAYEIQTSIYNANNDNDNADQQSIMEQLYYTKKQRVQLEKQLKRQVNLLRTVPNSMIGYTPDDFIASIRGIECLLDTKVQDEIQVRQKSIIQQVLSVQQQYQHSQQNDNNLAESLRETSLKISYKSKELALDLADYSTALEMLSQQNNL